VSDHLTPEDFFEFIDQGGDSGPAGHHLMDRPECLFELDFPLHPRKWLRWTESRRLPGTKFFGRGDGLSRWLGEGVQCDLHVLVTGPPRDNFCRYARPK